MYTAYKWMGLALILLVLNPRNSERKEAVVT